LRYFIPIGVKFMIIGDYKQVPRPSELEDFAPAFEHEQMNAAAMLLGR
jgi:hypothetical protein